jgi:hypothetical protein
MMGEIIDQLALGEKVNLVSYAAVYSHDVNTMFCIPLTRMLKQWLLLFTGLDTL